ncbi:MAG: YciI family protein [Actinomycetota bacterium]
MARYMLLIHGREAESRWDDAKDDERAEVYEAYGKLVARMQEQGHLIEGDELHRAADAKVVRVREGSVEVIDGPFTETNEQLGGYFLVDCDLESALEYAAAIPGARTGTVEVRPVVESPS